MAFRALARQNAHIVELGQEFGESGERKFGAMPTLEFSAERRGCEGIFKQAEDTSFGFAQQNVAAHRHRTGDERPAVAVALFGDFNVIRELWWVCAIIA